MVIDLLADLGYERQHYARGRAKQQGIETRAAHRMAGKMRPLRHRRRVAGEHGKKRQDHERKPHRLCPYLKLG